MSRAPLPNNPEVQTQRFGWCIYNRDTSLFLAAQPETGKHFQWVKAKDAYVYENGMVAGYQASILGGCVVTTVPRWNGHVWEFSEAP